VRVCVYVCACACVYVIYRKEPDLELEGLLKRHYTTVEFFQGTMMNAVDLERVKVNKPTLIVPNFISYSRTIFFLFSIDFNNFYSFLCSVSKHRPIIITAICSLIRNRNNIYILYIFVLVIDIYMFYIHTYYT